MKLSHSISCLLCLILTFNLNAQLSADFVSNTQFGCDFAQINFTNLTTDDGSAINCSTNYTYNWVFNPGNSNQCSPGNIFSTPGVYTVCLTVINNTSGEVNTECKTDYITIYSPPIPNFTMTPQEGCEPLEVCFLNTTVLESGSLVSCIWDFGDGQVLDQCTNQQVCHTYVQDGNYSVSLTVIDDNGCPPVTMGNTVNVYEPLLVSFTEDISYSCSTPLTVNFTNTSLTTNNVTFEWVFEGADIPNFVGINPPAITWNNIGSFDVTLIASDPNGCTDTLIMTDHITLDSGLDFAISNYNVCVGDTVFFEDLSINNPNSWQWDFGDGVGTANSANSFYVYNTAGCFTVTLTTNTPDCNNLMLTDTTCITVVDLPTISFTNNNPLGCQLPHMVDFTATSSVVGGTYEWIFGVDTLGTSNQANPSFTFNNLGTHEVTLNYTSIDGCVASFTDAILIEEIDVIFDGSFVEGCIPLTLTLNENSTSVALINDWQWTVPGIGVFNEESPAVTATDTGFYDVILQVTNEFGCVATDTFLNIIQAGEPQPVDFTTDLDLACANMPIQFSSLTTDYVDQWYWAFGDGGESTVPNPIYEYVDTGFFEVCLMVTQNGCENMICKPDFIQIVPPVARMLAIVPDCDAPYTYQFGNNSIAADSVRWNFGVIGIDTDTSSLLNPIYTYSAIGDYTVELVAFNFTTNCSDTVFALVQVREAALDFSITDTIGCAPFSVSPIDNSTYVTNYQWSSVSGAAIVTAGTTSSPTFQYNTGGMYPNDIQLIGADLHGCADTLVLDQDIYVDEVTANFTSSNPVGCAPLSVTLTDGSTSLFGNLNNWEWNDFGSNYVNSNQNTVVFDYNEADTFDVSLVVTNDLGCSGTLTLDDLIEITNPVALFTSDTIVCTTQNLSFVNQSIGQGMSYFWDFGDTNTSTLTNPVHAYVAEGVYNVCLTVTDVNNCDSTYCNMITVANPVADFVADTTFAFCPPLIVNFNNLSQNAVSGGSMWDFGDGTGFSNADSPAHVYTEGGSYDVMLIVTSPSGCQDTTVFQNYIELLGPIGSFNFNPLEGCAPLTVTFTTISLDPSLHIMDYGDGSIDSSANNVVNNTFTYTYTQAGEFTPAMILVDELGCNQVFDADSTIVVESLDIDFFASDTLLCDGGSTSFMNVVNSSLPITTLEWTFEGQNPETNTTLNPTNLVYQNNGLYDVQLTVSNGVCTDSLIKSDYIVVEETPVANFTAVPPVVCESEVINFMDNSTVGTGAIVDWAWDFGDTNTSNSQNTNNTYETAGTYDVTLTVSSINGCTDTEISSVDIVPLPDVILNPAADICIGESVMLDAQLLTNATGVTYSWDNLGTLSCNDCLNPVANPVITTTYTITATTLDNCTDTAQVTVNVIPFPVPNINLNADTLICEGTTIQLFANGGTADPSSYQWGQTVTGLSCYACPNPFASPLADTEYIVTVTGEGGCTSVDSVLITVFDPSQVFAGSDLTICEGESIVLSDGGLGTNPSWSPSTGLSCTFCPTPTASPTETITYGITIDDPVSGCQITDSILVEVVKQNSIDAGVDQLVCSGDPVQLNGVGDGTLSWTPVAVLDDANIASPTAVVFENTTFVLTATKGNCILTDEVEITVTDSVIVTAEDVDFCLGDSTMLNATGNAPTYQWIPAQGLSDPTIANPIVNVATTTNYTVSAQFGSCPSTVANVTVTVNNAPEVSILANHNFFAGSSVDLTINRPGGADYAYEWTPALGLSCSDCPNPTAAPDSSVVYTILVTDLQTGCDTTLVTELIPINSCDEFNLAVPNGFTPNGDGNNDLLLVRSTSITSINIFRVFDRWGALVFETTNISDGWDGTYKGRRMNPGVFVYYVETYCPLDGSLILEKGNVTLIR